MSNNLCTSIMTPEQFRDTELQLQKAAYAAAIAEVNSSESALEAASAAVTATAEANRLAVVEAEAKAATAKEAAEKAKADHAAATSRAAESAAAAARASKAMCLKAVTGADVLALVSSNLVSVFQKAGDARYNAEPLTGILVRAPSKKLYIVIQSTASMINSGNGYRNEKTYLQAGSFAFRARNKAEALSPLPAATFGKDGSLTAHFELPADLYPESVGLPSFSPDPSIAPSDYGAAFLCGFHGEACSVMPYRGPMSSPRIPVAVPNSIAGLFLDKPTAEKLVVLMVQGAFAGVTASSPNAFEPATAAASSSTTSIAEFVYTSVA